MGTTQVLDIARDRAAAWLPGATPNSVELGRVERKRYSTVHEVILRVGETPTRIFIKEPLTRGIGTARSRPHAILVDPPGPPARLQADALADLEGAVASSGMDALGAVKVLDCIDDRLLVMSAGSGIPLRKYVLRQVRWSRGGRLELAPVYEHAGQLLRLFHGEVHRLEAPTALANRDDLLMVAESFVEYLRPAVSLRRGPQLEGMHQRLRSQLERHLPAQLAVTTRFGDFGLTNVLVTAAGKVTAIDTLAALRTPPLHDATYFLSGLTAIRPQVQTRGLALAARDIRDWQNAFWRGYLQDSDHPSGAVSVWSVLRLLERWIAKTTRTSSRLARIGPGAMIDAYLFQLIDSAIDVAESAPAAPELVNALVPSP